MLGGIWSFIKRHRKKLIFSGILVGGIYYCGRYVERKLQEYKEKEKIEVILCAKKQQHFLNTQLICHETIKSLIGNLRNAMLQRIDISSLLTELKNRSDKKLEIWEQLKILSLTGVISLMYASCILILTLEIQMNLIAGKLLRKFTSNKNLLIKESFSEKCVTSADLTHYFNKIEDFLDKGIDDLLETVKAAVRDTVSNITLKDPISVQAFQGLFSSIRRKIEVREQNGYHDYIPFSLMHFMKFLEPNGFSNEQCGPHEASLKQINIQEKTYEILSGYDFQTTSNICLDWCFNYLVKRYENYFRMDDHDASSLNGKACSRPLAKVIPILNGEIAALLADHPNHFFMELLENPCISNFALNIYNQACTDEFLID